MSYQHTYAKLYTADDGATSGRLQMPFDVPPSEGTQDDFSSQSLVPATKDVKNQSRGYGKYFSLTFAVTFAISLGIGFGLIPQDVHAAGLDFTATVTKLDGYVPDAITGIVSLGAVSFAIIFVVGVVKIIRAVL
jgi:hypothetical protein